ncbi:MAG: aspartate carbamoyltransferase [Candidatus Moranbacteria bacterium]|nr:aspartate carbamoyltransferase [Candidatus Moranbacteria bacterium]
MQHLISIRNLDRQKIEQLIELANLIKKEPAQFAEKLDKKIIASLFFEASTRTRLSFEVASLRLGAKVIGFADKTNTSYGGKGESLEDTIRIVGGYADLIVMRHPEMGSVELAAQVVNRPLINAGDGANEHPTQTLLDLMTIKEIRGALDGLKIALWGDLKYGRTARSLALGLANYENVTIYCVHHPGLGFVSKLRQELKRKNLKLELKPNIKQVLKKADIIYATRTQTERFKSEQVGTKKLNILTINKKMLENCNPALKILHPLPRRQELDPEIDKTKHAHYFEQARNGMYIRMALLVDILEKSD